MAECSVPPPCSPSPYQLKSLFLLYQFSCPQCLWTAAAPRHREGDPLTWSQSRSLFHRVPQSRETSCMCTMWCVMWCVMYVSCDGWEEQPWLLVYYSCRHLCIALFTSFKTMESALSMGYSEPTHTTCTKQEQRQAVFNTANCIEHSTNSNTCTMNAFRLDPYAGFNYVQLILHFAYSMIYITLDVWTIS